MKDAAPAAAWRVPPEAYLATRPAEGGVPAPVSEYVAMRDGCRIAVDTYLPGDGTGRYPCLLFLTPYYRRFALAQGSPADPNPNTGKFRDFFVPRGYAVVVADVRGTGASFGTRDGFRSPAERLDSAEIADWIVAQGWSDGRIGATGVSYLGAAADFLASTGHPAVKAIAPLFSVWDTWSDNYFPGGLQIASLTQHYDRLMEGLDLDRRELLRDFSYYANPDFRGPQPVDADPDGTLLAEALAEHRGNFRQTGFMADLRYREEGLPYDPDYSSAAFSPYHYAQGIRPDVAVMSVSGWMDGAGYANGAIARHLTLKDNPRHLLLGPWDHGARIDVSPWRAAETPGFPLLAEVLRFFDTYLMERGTGLRDEAPVHVYAMHEEEWHALPDWPAEAGLRQLFPQADGSLGAAPGQGAAAFAADPGMGTGTQTRYERIAGIDCRSCYPDWQGRSAAMLHWDSAPLEAPFRLLGHAHADLEIVLDTADAAIFAYLTEVEADGTERHVTEGMLRVLHRAEALPPPEIAVPWIWRSFRREDAAPAVPGERMRLRLPLLPVGWQFAAGSRIRLSLSGGDADHFGKVPHGRLPRADLALAGCRIALPELAA
ncbi:CocE/NonD family hydrolase [Mangrovicoccus sp. HB161399]|uniref:CocE/NonD family hydrolase n=1 Tax=Mangrovicoccus sp. HB161399 TaxID=2720392 RepID=UPI0015567921|nr:CocE/NonD family hydrolase [Mangrovicoccus sp. HB161399]